MVHGTGTYCTLISVHCHHEGGERSQDTLEISVIFTIFQTFFYLIEQMKHILVGADTF